ncbi:MAG: glycosyl transferase [Planctomycetaceae bacterium]|nr:glycosyl transferase [Planctomycetaceae bacterium]MBP63848.1 glycosyl transferase [Planctomycetaceae bacterium]
MKNRLLVDGAVSLRNWFLEPAICCSGSILNSLLKRLRKRALEGDLKLHSNTTSAGNPVLAAEIQTTSASNTDSSSEISSGIEQTICRTLSVLIPVYNERWTVATVIQRVLGTKVPLDLEIIAVDDGSTDGSADILDQLACKHPQLNVVRHPKNSGKGTAIRTAIKHMTGDVAVVQDADLEYDPADYILLLRPILDGKADAVYGSRFAGHPRRVLFFWHSLANRFLTLVSNMFNDLNLTDMETCFKMVRSDVLKQLRLRSETFTFEPELTCRLAQWGARLYEVPISYSGRTYQEGKKIRATDGLKALWQMFYTRFVDIQFTDHSGFYILLSTAKAQRYNRWIVKKFQQFLGNRLLEAGSGTGNLSGLLLNRERVVLLDSEKEYVACLEQRYGWYPNVRVEGGDLTKRDTYNTLQDERIDTILCSNVLEHLENDRQVLAHMHETLEPEGHCIILAPAEPWLYNGIDEELGHCRRYRREELRTKMQEAGFEIVMESQFNRLAWLPWAFSGHILRRRHLSPRQIIWFDRIIPLAKLLEHCLPTPGLSLLMVGKKTS